MYLLTFCNFAYTSKIEFILLKKDSIQRFTFCWSICSKSGQFLSKQWSMKFSSINIKFWLICFIKVKFLARRIQWDIVAVMLPYFVSRKTKLENILSMRAFGRLVILLAVWYKRIRDKGILKSLVDCCSLQFRRLILNSPRRKTCFYSLARISKI